jgi:hypothetical protein
LRATSTAVLVLAVLAALAYAFARGALSEVSSDPSSDSGVVQGVAFVGAVFGCVSLFCALVLPAAAYYLSSRDRYSQESFFKAVLLCLTLACSIGGTVVAVVLGSAIASVPFAIALFAVGAVPVAVLTGWWDRLAQ